MNELERKLHLKYRNIEKKDAIIMPEVTSIRLFIQVNALLFLLFCFFKTYFQIAQEEFKQPI